VRFSVFTKPWPTLGARELGALVRGMGFEAVELPVRPGFQVPPEDVARGLPAFCRALAEEGVRVVSVAGPATEACLAACAEAGVPLVRVMFPLAEDGYLAAEARARRELERVAPLCARYGVRVGVQNHSGRFVAPNAFALQRLLAGLNPACVGAVWDAAHNALEGEGPETALEVIWPHLLMVNLKNGLWLRTNGPEARWAEWRVWWTSGRHGLASWPRVAAALRARGYDGVICLTAEYSAHGPEEAQRLAREDLAFARELFAGP
jgi:sugar phosphate isomerase/epimerase